MRSIPRILIAVALLVAGCSPSQPALPDSDPSALHDLFVGSNGVSFLGDISTYDWPDDGAKAGDLFRWIPGDATSADPSVAMRAAESASALANYLASHRPQLLDISTGIFDSDHTTVGALNPKLVQAYSEALVPYQGALACYSDDHRGFAPLNKECRAAVGDAINLVTVLNSDPTAEASFTNAAYRQMDDYITRFADGIVDPTRHFSRGPATAGRLLGILKSASAAGVAVRAPLEGVLQANYLITKRLLANDPNSGIPAEYFTDGTLMSPTEIGDRLGSDAVAGYGDSLSTYLTTRDNVETFITHDFYDAYKDVVASN
jgi:hypothetical protein